MLKTKYNKVYGILLFFLFIIFFVFSGLSLKNTVLALTGNYNRTISDNSLSLSDWNKLDEDFVIKSGDVMQGNLDMSNWKITNLANPIANNDAVNKASLDSAIAAISAGGSANIKDASGNSLKMVCGSTPYGSTNWSNSVGSITLVVDTSIAGFANNNVTYFTSLHGDSAMYRAVGYNGIYEPTANSFRIYINNNDINSPFNPLTARDSYKWYIRWCGIGQ